MSSYDEVLSKMPEMCFCRVNNCVRDKILQRPPLLVLPQVRCARVQGLPDTVEPINMNAGRVAKLEAIVTVVEDDKYGYHCVARDLRNIARNAALPTCGAGTSCECWQ